MDTKLNIDLSWIESENLQTVFTKLLKIQKHNSSRIDGKILGLVTKRLVESEINPGGPYVNRDSIKLNSMIFRFLKNQGIHLKDLEQYLLDCISSDLYDDNIKLIIKKYLYPDSTETKVVELSALNAVEKLFEDEILKFSTDIQKTLTRKWTAIKTIDSRKEISLLSSYFIDSLNIPSKINQTSEELGLANIYAWIAYTIYDSVIDDFKDSESLPTANIAQRASMEKYLKYGNFEYINSFFNYVDDASSYELQNQRAEIRNSRIDIKIIPDYKDLSFLANKTIGHTLGPRIIVQNLKGIQESQIQDINIALSHYLIARQLSDDIHDWKKDLSNGHMSYVVNYLLKATEVSEGTYDMNELTKKLSSFFWSNGLNNLAKIVIDQVDLCEKHLTTSKLIRLNSPFFKQLIYPLKDMSIESMSKLADQKDFLVFSQIK